MQDNVAAYVDARVKHDIQEEHIAKEKKPERREELEKQAQKVKEALVNERLKARYQLKITSKAPCFAGIDWDAKLKAFDASGSMVKFPYATCRIKFQREFSFEPYLFLGGRAFDAVQLNFSKEELQHLAYICRTIVDKLTQLEKEYNIAQS